MGKELKEINSIEDIPRIEYPMEVRGMEKVKIKMRETKPGVDDGKIQAEDFLEGETYDVGPDLAAAFVGAEFAEEVEESKDEGEEARAAEEAAKKKEEEEEARAAEEAAKKKKEEEEARAAEEAAKKKKEAHDNKAKGEHDNTSAKKDGPLKKAAKAVVAAARGK
jgi:glucan-binding YG repeat protein